MKPSINSNKSFGSSKKSSSSSADRQSPAAVESSSTTAPSFEAVAMRAYEIWERSGCQDGRDLENWIQAEKEIRESQSNSSSQDWSSVRRAI